MTVKTETLSEFQIEYTFDGRRRRQVRIEELIARVVRYLRGLLQRGGYGRITITFTPLEPPEPQPKHRPRLRVVAGGKDPPTSILKSP